MYSLTCTSGSSAAFHFQPLLVDVSVFWQSEIKSGYNTKKKKEQDKLG